MRRPVGQLLAVGAEPADVLALAVGRGAGEERALPQHRVAAAERDEAGHERDVVVGGPVQPRDRPVLAVRVVVAALRPAPLVARRQQRHAGRQQQRRQHRPSAGAPVQPDRGVVGGSLGAAVPAAVVVRTVAVVLAVGLVVLVVVGDEVGEGEPVVDGDEVDRRLRVAAAEQVARGPGQPRTPGRRRRRARRATRRGRCRGSGRSTPTTGSGTRRARSRRGRRPTARRRASTPCSTGSCATADRNAERASKPPSVRDSAGARSKRKPSTCISETQYRRLSRIVASIGGWPVSTVLPQPVTSCRPVVRGVQAAPAERRLVRLALGGVVVDDVEEDLDARGVQRPHHRPELGDGIARGIGGVGANQPRLL